LISAIYFFELAKPIALSVDENAEIVGVSVQEQCNLVASTGVVHAFKHLLLSLS
jgi:hypothetical protein